ncbi:MAG: MlaD family protein [Solirubrobacteraceae bacterium]
MRAPRFWKRRDRVPVAELSRYKPARFGAGLIVLIALGVYFGFTQKLPFTHGYRFKAVFSSAQDMAPKTPVRIAGVPVGEVVSIRREGTDGLAEMEVAGKGLPIHQDAELKIRPRLFLEGNWYVELRPGTPSSPDLQAGGTIGIAQTAIPVQIDQVLNALNTSTRTNLQQFVDGYGEALTHVPNAAENAEQEPEVRGLTGAQALKESERYGPPALRNGAITSQALTGVEQHDISKLIAGLRRVSRGLAGNEQALGEWVGNFDHFLEELADQASSLKATVAELPSALRSTSSAFRALTRAAPVISSFANAITPGVAQTHSTIAAALPWIVQLERLLGRRELGGVAAALQEATPSLASLINGQKPFFKQTELFSKCLTNVFYPAGNVHLADGNGTSPAPDYREFFYTLTGINGIGQNFDGNGMFPRFLTGGTGHLIVSHATSIVGVKKSEGVKLVSHANEVPKGTAPAFPKSEPPYRPLVACDTQKVPNLNGPLSRGPSEAESVE